VIKSDRNLLFGDRKWLIGDRKRLLGDRKEIDFYSIQVKYDLH